MTLFARSQPTAADAIDVLRQAAELNWNDPYREGSMLQMPGFGQIVMTGDLHGHFRNFDKLQKYAMLDRAPARHVVLHEMVHKDVQVPGDPDDSHLLLVMAAAYKCEFPDQVHFLQSNHELAQFTGYTIAKNGRIVIDDYNNAVRQTYGERQGEEVLAAMSDFIAAFPLAIRTPNRVWMSHSLPDIHNMDQFDPTIFKKPMTRAEIADSRSAFLLVWGRRHTPEHIQRLADAFDVDIMITGHQPQDQGMGLYHDRLIILDSSHNHGTFLPFDLAKPQTPEGLMPRIRKYVEVA